jgi:hypothetical protein
MSRTKGARGKHNKVKPEKEKKKRGRPKKQTQKQYQHQTINVMLIQAVMIQPHKNSINPSKCKYHYLFMTHH